MNSALSGGRVQDVPDMINYVVKELKTTYNATIDFNNDWKLATLLIGANNLCGACHNDSGDDPDSYETELNNVIQMMYEQIPRVRLNLLPMFNIGQVPPTPIPSIPIQSNPIQFIPTHSHPIPSNPIHSFQSNPIPSNPFQSNPIHSFQSIHSSNPF